MSQEVETPNVHGLISARDSQQSKCSLAHLRGELDGNNAKD